MDPLLQTGPDHAPPSDEARDILVLPPSTESSHLRSVLILAHSWPPDAYVGAVRPVYLSRQLARLGWQPIVLTVKEQTYERINPAGIAGSDSALVVRTYCIKNPRHAYLWLKSFASRIHFGRSRNATANHENQARTRREPSRAIFALCRLKRTFLSLIHTPDEFLGWYPFALLGGIRLMLRFRPACIISTAPPFTSHLVARMLKTLFNTPWIADFRDPWSWREGLPPEISSALSDRISKVLEKGVIYHADRIVCVTPGTTERYRQMYPQVSADKWLTVTNGYDRDEFAGLCQSETPTKFTISYVGGFDFSRSPRLLLRSVSELIAEGLIDKSKLAVRFVGPCETAEGIPIVSMIDEYDLLEVVEITGLVPRPEALKAICQAHLLLLLGGSQRLSIAAKVYEYLAAGTPILAIAQEGEIADLVRSVGAGYVVSPEDLTGAKYAIATRYGDCLSGRSNDVSAGPHRNGAAEAYSWDGLGLAYSEIIKQCSILPPRG